MYEDLKRFVEYNAYEDHFPRAGATEYQVLGRLACDRLRTEAPSTVSAALLLPARRWEMRSPFAHLFVFGSFRSISRVITELGWALAVAYQESGTLPLISPLLGIRTGQEAVDRVRNAARFPPERGIIVYAEDARRRP